MSDQPQGLYGKYLVRELGGFLNGQRTAGPPLTDVFVLRPEKDPAALKALFAYAAETSNLELSSDLLAWCQRIVAREDTE